MQLKRNRKKGTLALYQQKYIKRMVVRDGIDPNLGPSQALVEEVGKHAQVHTDWRVFCLVGMPLSCPGDGNRKLKTLVIRTFVKEVKTHPAGALACATEEPSF